MTWFPTFRRSILWLCLGVAVGSTPASAADVIAPDGTPLIGRDGYPVRQSKLEAACSTSLARFCPDLAETPGQTRNQVTCLKPYRASLSPGCRSMVSGAAKK